MPEPVSAVSIEQLLATTRVKISRMFANSINDRIPLFNKLNQSGNVKEVLDGGRSFYESAIGSDSLACGPYRAQDVLDVSEQDGITTFKYFPALAYASIFIDNPTLALNAGEAATLDILDGRLEQARSSLMNVMDQIVCGAHGTVYNGKPSDFIGLQDIVSDTNTSTIPETGVDRSLAKYAKLRNQVDTTSIATAAAFNTSAAGRNLMTALYLACSFGTDRPTLCLMTRTVYAAYDASLQANERFLEIKQKAGGGYPKLVFMADCEVAFGDNVLDGHFYFLNTNKMKWKVLAKKNMDISDFVPAYNQDAKRALITIAGQLTTGAPKYSGVATGLGF